MSGEELYCKKCRKTMKPDKFYGSNNLEKYPEGKLDTCKNCITLHVDNWSPETFLWILQECDVPYVPDEWTDLLQKYADKPDKMTSMTILGRYLAKMKLKQWKDYRWKDTEHLQQVAEARMENAMKRQGYEAAQIALAKEQSKMVITEDMIAAPRMPGPEVEDYFDQWAEGDDPDIDLTEEDKTYLRLKWGKTYKPDEWVKLEQLYEDMMGSYDIQTAGHIDTLKLVCKTSLKANQLIDIGDVEGFQKMQKAYDSLMKSGNFTGLQNKTENGNFIDSIGELISICEKDGYIERYYTDSPNDKVDLTIADMQRYTRSLIENETSLTLMVEKALLENAREDAQEAELDSELEIIDESDLSIEELEKSIVKDTDYEEFNDFVDKEKEQDLDDELDWLNDLEVD